MTEHEESSGERRGRPPRIAFAGDRDLAVWVLDYLLEQRVEPLALLLSGPERASHADELRRRCSHLPDDRVIRGREFRDERGLECLRSLDLDLIVSVHFPYLFDADVLSVPREGVLNLHPALLPYARGWHTPSWTILDGTPAGATLHFMDEGLDTGDIVHQQALEVSPGDTADTLYGRLKQLELEVFATAWPMLADGSYSRTRQPAGGTMHRRRDLLTPEIQRLDLDAPSDGRSMLRRLRALTTNRVDEAAYFVENGIRYRVQVYIHAEPA